MTWPTSPVKQALTRLEKVRGCKRTRWQPNGPIVDPSHPRGHSARWRLPALWAGAASSSGCSHRLVRIDELAGTLE